MSKQNTSTKVVLLGETMVGKTSIVNAYTSKKYTPDITPTVGACFQIMKVVQDGKTIRLNIWDTAGQERFRSLAPMFYRDADFVILVYAIDNRSSFEAINQWYDSLRYDCPVFPKVYLVGNKIDLQEQRVVEASEGQKKAAENNSDFFEVSAKTGTEEINDLFEHIVSDVIQLIPNSNFVTENESPLKQNYSCC